MGLGPGEQYGRGARIRKGRIQQNTSGTAQVQLGDEDRICIPKENIMKNRAIKQTLKHVQSTYGIRPEAKKFPLMCVIAFTYACNSRCPSCPYTNSAIRASYKDRIHMSEETFKLIADQCGKYHSWIRVSGGGEPLIHPRAVPLFIYAKKAGARVGLITNGSLFSEQNMRQLLSANIDMIEFSVDAADNKTYKKVRPGLSWDKLLKTVKKIVAIRNATGASTKIIASAINQQGVDMEKAACFWEPIVDCFQKRKFLTWGINDPSQSADPEPYLPPENRIPCPFLFERLNIDTRGKVLMCGLDIAGKTNMGNVHKESIRNIWLGKKFSLYRKRHLDREGNKIALCSVCPDWKYRSWQHNYWKIVKNAENRKNKRIGRLKRIDK
jgi:MoaA/NifB/PqqE/SkfB family radical SAM enzyme